MRDEPPRRGRTRSLAVLSVAVAVITMGGAAATSQAWQRSVETTARNQFHEATDRFEETLERRLDDLEDLPRAIAMEIERLGEFQPDVLTLHADAANALIDHPGALGLGYLRLDDAAPSGIRLVAERSLIGDTQESGASFADFFDASLRAALDESARTGNTVAAAPRVLDMVVGMEDEPIFLMVTPVLTEATDSAGWVATSVYGNLFVRDAVASAAPALRARIDDGQSLVAGDWFPFSEEASTQHAALPADAPRATFTLEPFGRPWSVVLADPHGALGGRAGNEPAIVLAAGAALSLALAGLVWVLGRSRSRALTMVDAATSELRSSEERFRLLVQHGSDVVVITDEEHRITSVGESMERMFGWTEEEVVGLPLSVLLDAGERDITLARMAARPGAHRGATRVVQHRIRHRDGSWGQSETVVADLLDRPAVGGIVLTMRDVTERHELAEQLRHQAFHDTLTGLANRALFADRVAHALARRGPHPVGLLFGDLDDFKTVNDSLGHAAGDEVLVEVSARIRGFLRTGDTAARLGGDEFAILVEDVTDEDELRSIAERMLDVIAEPMMLDGRPTVVTGSVGMVLYDDIGAEAHELVRDADIAMYQAKASGKGRCEVFRPGMRDQAVYRLELKTDLAHVTERGELVVHYQPIVELHSGRLTGVEALLRWDHPTRGRIGPDEFIPLAEETGEIVPVGRWVLEQACRRTVEWNEASCLPGPLRINVNVSAIQLTSPDFADDVASILAMTGLDPSLLVLELTESVLLHDTEQTLARLRELKGLGVQLAVDDFGTGYSSLGYLQRFPIDVIKIDRSFVDAVDAEDGSGPLVRAIIDLAQQLAAQTVAEGIELPTQLAALRNVRCAQGQGYLFARPIDADAILDLVRDGLDTRSWDATASAPHTV